MCLQSSAVHCTIKIGITVCPGFHCFAIRILKSCWWVEFGLSVGIVQSAYLLGKVGFAACGFLAVACRWRHLSWKPCARFAGLFLGESWPALASCHFAPVQGFPFSWQERFHSNTGQVSFLMILDCEMIRFLPAWALRSAGEVPCFGSSFQWWVVFLQLNLAQYPYFTFPASNFDFWA